MSIGKPQSSIRMIVYLTLALFILMASWEANRSTAALAADDIPQDAIRLRILANSDTVSDQWIKHKIRDAIVDEMQKWVTGPQTVDEARTAIREHLPEIRNLANGLLDKYGYNYRATAELGVVPFPTKMYGDKVYPAGNYEALRVSLGKAEGQNWWCVLFPPLCFVDAVTNEAVAKDDKKASPESGQNSATPAAASAAKASGSKADSHGKDESGKASITAASAKAGTGNVAAPATAAEKQQEGKTQVKFFVWEMLKKLFAKLF
jgi:stage II sporulation protein R